MPAWTSNPLTQRLGLTVPIVQGPFGGGLSSVELAATVSNAGGLGSFGVHHLDAHGIAQVADGLRAATSRPFALNLWIPHEDADDPQIDDAAFARCVEILRPYFDELGEPLPQRPERFAPRYAEQVEAVLAAKPAVFSFVFGVPSREVLDRCKVLDIVTVGAATTRDEAVALAQAGVDAIVATGAEAGGHRVSFLRGAEESLTGTLALVPQVVDAVNVPVIAAGGIADGRGVAAALALGAQAAQVGTAFFACRESNAPAQHHDALFSNLAQYTGLTRAFSGRLARGIRNRLMDELRAHEAQLAPYPVQNWLTGRLKAAAIRQGRADLMSLWCGQAAALIREHDAAALMRRLVAETEAAFARFVR